MWQWCQTLRCLNFRVDIQFDSYVNSWWRIGMERRKKNQCKHLWKTYREWSEMQNKFCLTSCAAKCLSGLIIKNLCKAIMKTCLKYDWIFFSSLFVIWCQVWLDNRRLDLARIHIEKLIFDYCPRCAELHFKNADTFDNSAWVDCGEAERCINHKTTVNNS